MSENQTTANPEVAEETSANVEASPSQEDVNEAVFGSADGFFDALDRDVNGAIIDDEDYEVQETIDTLPDMATQQEDNYSSADPSSEDVNWEKRFKDSSREAQKLKARRIFFD